MKTYIALLRGINVSGQKKVPMAELRDLLTKAGFQKVQTYIQSGNVIFQSDRDNKTELESIIQKTIEKHFGFEVPILVKTASEIENILNSCPFSKEKKEAAYFTLLHAVPDEALIESTSQETYQNEAFVIENDCVYFYSETGYGKAKCNNNFFERKLKVTATTRNYKTMLKLLSLSTETT
ncbi:DUF1697 domain-containing protein [Flavobacteriaceae bacterium XHP0103]|uniref:DUF1697 domain-containing protein n=1 Tax=Marixanthotalea marina TaxID=2844359 RepID=UPI002989A4DB|nr:DUF1697 domain-containing protein [Marixanthotalea marina]MBU3821090.1 DUF1697 domain-containing protein [Marixanthotalea marina]